MKKLFFTGLLSITLALGLFWTGCRQLAPDTIPPDNPQSVDDITAAQLVSKIKVGWNLGNTLDAGLPTWIQNPTIDQIESTWVGHVTTKANINAIKSAGFNAIRIPVSWTKCADSNYNIRSDWMARVTRIVNWAVDNDMYIILNTHHDEDVFRFMNSNINASLAAFQKIWEQIAGHFKNYNEKLIFEGLNEPRTPGSSAEWSGGTAEERNNLNKYYQTFVDTVRASGGNNDKRMLMINAYGASVEATAMNALALPNDTVPNKLIVSFHSYAPYNFALNKDSPVNTWNKNSSNDTNPITQPIDRYYNKFTANGIPVIIGEFGAMNKNNESTRAEWAKYYVDYARSKGMPCFWWDNAVTSGDGEKFGLLNRQNNSFTYPSIVTALTGETEYTPQPPAPGGETVTIILEANGIHGWQGMYYPASLFNGAVITQGDAYTFTYSFTSSVAMDFFRVILVDNCEATNWGWTVLSGYDCQIDAITADTVYNGTMTINATETATNATPEANKLVFQAGAGTASSPTLNFTALDLIKIN